MWLYTPPVYISHNIFEGPITLRILDRFGSTIVSMIALCPSPCRHTPTGFWSVRGMCGERAPVVYVSACIHHRWCTEVYKGMWLYTPPVYISHNILQGPITLGILDRFGSTIASMIAPAHGDILQLFSVPPEVCAANERRWYISASIHTTGGVYQV